MGEGGSCVVCFTGFEPEQRDTFTQQLTVLGAKVSRNFNSSVTHLVASRSGSAKHRAAAQVGVPVVGDAWVRQCVSSGHTRVPHELFGIQPLTGMKVAVTGLDKAEKATVQQLCQEFGGVYTSALTKDTTHLLVPPTLRYSSECSERIENAKVRAAVVWEVTVVSYAWIHHQVRTKGLADEADFSVDEFAPPRPDTPLQNQQAVVCDAEPSLAAVGAACEDDPWFLEGCCFWFVALSETQIALAIALCRRTGAKRVPYYCERVTHVLVGGSLTDPARVDLVIAKEQHPSQYVLSIAWLFQCWNLRHRCVEGHQFRYADYHARQSAGVDSPGQQGRDTPDTENMSNKGREIASKDWSDWHDSSQRAAAAAPVTPLAPPAPAAAITKTPSSSRFSYRPSSVSKALAPKQEPVTSPQRKPLKPLPSPVKSPLTRSRATRSEELFFGLQFVVSAIFTTAHANKAKEIAKKHGAKVVRAFSDPSNVQETNFLVSPHEDQMHQIARQPQAGSYAEVSLDWLVACDKERALVPLGQNLLHRPVVRRPPPSARSEDGQAATKVAQPVVCLTGIHGKLKDDLIRAAKLLGGSITSALAQAATTHLVGTDSGADRSEKYRRAHLWGIPIVSPEWVRSSARAGYFLLEETFLLAREGAAVTATTTTPNAKRRRTDAGECVTPLRSPAKATTLRCGADKQPAPAEADAPQAAEKAPRRRSSPPQKPSGSVAVEIEPYVDTFDNAGDAIIIKPKQELRHSAVTNGRASAPFDTSDFVRSLEADLNAEADDEPVQMQEDLAPQHATQGSDTMLAEAVRMLNNVMSVSPALGSGVSPSVGAGRVSPPAVAPVSAVVGGFRRYSRREMLAGSAAVPLGGKAPPGSDPWFGSGRGAASPESDGFVVDSQGSQIVRYDHGHSQVTMELLYQVKEETAQPHSELKQHRSSAFAVPPAVGKKTTQQPTPVAQPQQRVTVDVALTPSQGKDKSFVLSGFKEERQSLVEIITRLGGKVVTLCSECTHLVSKLPTRTEKYLAAVAAGKWIVTQGYLVACDSAGRWVEEEPFEWSTVPDSVGEPRLKEPELALCVRKWRQREGRAFTGWRALLNVSESTRKGFAEILRAGNAEVVGQWQDKPTHVFFDHSNGPVAPLVESLQERLQDSTALFLQTEFIVKWLAQDNPQPGNHLAKDLDHIREKKRKRGNATDQISDSVGA